MTSLDTDFAWSVSRLSDALVTEGSPAVAHLPQGARGYLLLLAVADGGAASQLTLGRRLGIDKTAMTRLVDALEDATLVTRQADRADRRTRRIVLTADGEKALTLARDGLAAAEAAILAPLTDDERRQFRTLLTRVATTTPATACEPA